jgi:crossover junction endodeoxyribonuclease RuvC
MVLEKIYVHYHHQTTAFLLGQARGIICLACAQGNIPLVEYAATRIKKAIVGKGLASKAQVQRMVAKTLRLKSLPRYMDVTDALALAIAYSNIAKSDINRTAQ